MAKKWVYLYDELDQASAYVGGDWENVRGLLGRQRRQPGGNDPYRPAGSPGFTVTTEACNAYLAAGMKFPEGMWEQELAALAAVEKKTGKKFGDPKNPLLVSCRSGAKFSMPGMMDTVLNIGLNEETVKGMIEVTGDPRFVYDSYRRLIQMFGSVVMGVPDEPFEEVITECRKSRSVKSDAELTAEDWKDCRRTFKDIFRRYNRIDFPTDPYRAAASGDRSRLQVLERQARHRLPQRRQDRPRPRHGRQHPDHGFRQHGRRQRHRRGHDPQRHHRREEDRRRLPDQRPG